MKRTLAAIALLFLAACDKDIESPIKGFVDTYGGDAYEGRANVVAMIRGEEYSQYANALFQINPLQGDTVAVSIIIDVSPNNSANFVIKGFVDDQGWSSIEDQLQMQITHAGQISGQTSTGQELITFEGQIEPEALRLTTDIEQLQDLDNFPAGTLLSFIQTGDRDVPDEQEERDNPGTGCRMETRAIYTPDGLVLGMVPVCD